MKNEGKKRKGGRGAVEKWTKRRKEEICRWGNNERNARTVKVE